MTHKLTSFVRLISLLVAMLGAVYLSRANHFPPQDALLTIIWWLTGVILILTGGAVCVYMPWRSDKEWHEYFRLN